MRFTGFSAALMLAFTAMLVAPTARADAPCNKGFRTVAPAERATMTAVLQAVKKALPAAPAGWQQTTSDDFSLAGDICRDGETRPWNYDFNRGYKQVGDAEARQAKYNAAIARFAADQKAKQPRLDALRDKNMKLSDQRIVLLQKGDNAGAARLEPEIVKVQAEYQKIAESGNGEQILTAASKEMHRDFEMSISVQINPGVEGPEAGAQNLTLPVGAFAAYRWDTSDENADTGHALFLYGKWIRNAQGRLMPVGRANVAATAANAMAVKVTADPNRLPSLLQAIDFQTLSTALAK